jgi:hypothetical protein
VPVSLWRRRRFPIQTKNLCVGVLQERPDAVLPTMGGQTGLNLAKALSEVRRNPLCVPSTFPYLLYTLHDCIAAFSHKCASMNEESTHSHEIFFALPVQQGILDKYNVELIGAKLPSINRAEDRELFKQAMVRIGLKTPPSGTVNNWEEALQVWNSADGYGLFLWTRKF